MFAVVEIAGFQEKVEQGAKLQVPLLKTKKEGDEVTFDQVLMVSNGKDVSVGAPYVAGASVTVKILGVGQTDKVRGAKFKRRKRYLKFFGHRQDYMNVEVTGIKS